jgi:hypothetical protein
MLVRHDQIYGKKTSPLILACTTLFRIVDLPGNVITDYIVCRFLGLRIEEIADFGPFLRDCKAKVKSLHTM